MGGGGGGGRGGGRRGEVEAGGVEEPVAVGGCCAAMEIVFACENSEDAELVPIGEGEETAAGEQIRLRWSGVVWVGVEMYGWHGMGLGWSCSRVCGGACYVRRNRMS